ncbi:MAG: DUF4139 domain-containing protein [Candidatus Hydrogenedentes bacterium]|nr:DUF4139 domain-containing protein [Candidatus Hydrogenedentota bacterium]
MNRRIYRKVVSVLAVVTVTAMVTHAGTATEQNALRSTEKDQTDVALTAYNNGVALVRDMRTVNLPKGSLALNVMDVAAKIIPETVHVEQRSSGRPFEIEEQNYEYDLISPDTLLRKFVGKQVILRETSSETLQVADRKATLLSVEGGRVYQSGDKILLNPQGTVIVPEVPGNLVSRPTLSWLVNCPRHSDYQFETSYLTEGVSWKADYVAVLNEDDTMMDLSAWVTLDNRSGVGYKNAQLKLVAGDVRRVQPPSPRRAFGGERAIAYAAKAAPAFREESLFEYHLYDLQRRTNIKNNQTKQIALLDVSQVPLTKKYLVKSTSSMFSSRPPTQDKPKVRTILEFDNKGVPGLGVPLPAGTVRTYKRDSKGALQFTGEDNIKHTPRDETVKLTVGSAFDIVAERKQTDYKKIAPREFETEIKVDLRNRKDAPVTVTVEEFIPGDWAIIEKNHPYMKKDAHTVEFEVNIDARSATTFTYRARISQ